MSDEMDDLTSYEYDAEESPKRLVKKPTELDDAMTEICEQRLKITALQERIGELENERESLKDAYLQFVELKQKYEIEADDWKQRAIALQAALAQSEAIRGNIKLEIADLWRRLGVAAQLFTTINEWSWLSNGGAITVTLRQIQEFAAEALKAIQSTEAAKSNIGGYCSCGDLIKQATFRSCSTDEIDTCLGERSRT